MDAGKYGPILGQPSGVTRSQSYCAPRTSLREAQGSWAFSGGCVQLGDILKPLLVTLVWHHNQRLAQASWQQRLILKTRQGAGDTEPRPPRSQGPCAAESGSLGRMMLAGCTAAPQKASGHTAVANNSLGFLFMMSLSWGWKPGLCAREASALTRSYTTSLFPFWFQGRAS